MTVCLEAAGPSFGAADACRQEMQRCELFRTGGMNVAKGEHVFESVFAPTLVAAASFECSRVFEWYGELPSAMEPM